MSLTKSKYIKALLKIEWDREWRVFHILIQQRTEGGVEK